MTIIPRGKDKEGRTIYQVQVSGGRDASGKRVRKTVTVHGGKGEAKQAEARLSVEVQLGGANSSMTFAQWVEMYVRQAERRVADRSMAASTLAGYKRMLLNRILPALGRYRLDALQPRHIAALYRTMEKDTYKRTFYDKEGKPLPSREISASTRSKHHQLISVILHEAQYAGLLNHNPAQSVRAPRRTKKEGPHFTSAELAKLLTALRRMPLECQVPIMLMLRCGLRRGEVIAVQWGDVLLDRGFVIVRHSAETIDGEQVLKVPKTEASADSVPIDDDLVTLLRQWREQQALAGPLAHRFVCSYKGRWMKIDHLSRWYRRFARAAGLPHTGLHALRHTYASIMAGKVTIEGLRRLMRHSSANVTLGNYSHLIDEVDEAARGLVGQAMAAHMATPAATQPDNTHNTNGSTPSS